MISHVPSPIPIHKDRSRSTEKTEKLENEIKIALKLLPESLSPICLETQECVNRSEQRSQERAFKLAQFTGSDINLKEQSKKHIASAERKRK